MNRILFIAMVMSVPYFAIAQTQEWPHIDLDRFLKKLFNDTEKSGGDYYVVDSIYCYLYNDSLGMEVPISRSYNLAFTDEEGNILEILSQRYSIISQEWTNTLYSVNAYDGEGNLIETTIQQWDSILSNWRLSRKTIIQPNEFGNYVHVLDQEWDDADNEWRNLRQQNANYNDDGLIQTLEYEEWDTLLIEWKKVFRIAYAHNVENQLASTFFQLFQNGAYQNISREIFSYDPVFTELETERLTEIWLSDSMTWQASSRTMNEYDANANLAIETIQKWDIPNLNWLNELRALRNYNSNGDVTLKTELIWGGMQWDNYFQTEYTYDSVFNQTRFETIFWNNDEWTPVNSCDLFWRFHHEVVSTRELMHLSCGIPNPMKTGLPFLCDELNEIGPSQLSIFDLSGKRVYTSRIENQNFINIAEPISTGLYILNLTTENGQIFSKKIVIVDP